MKRIDPFTVMLPTLDLHGETYETMKYILESFIKDNYKLGKKIIIVIHGRSGNVLKNRTTELLKNNVYVNKFYIDFNNDGQTIIELKKQV